MKSRFFVPQDGTIEDAVKIIQPDGTIEISAGRYLLKETILIEKPLRMEGVGIEKTVFFSTLNIDLIRVKTGGEFSIKGIFLRKDELEELSQCEDNSGILNMPEPSSSILRIDEGIADISDCKFAGHESLKSHGISLYGESRAKIKGNELSGFFFAISSRMNAFAEVIGNHCEKNHSGIAFLGSSSGSATENFCRLSVNCGILVREEASPQISGNRCEENGVGVGFAGSSSGSATENICRLNKAFGILVRNEASPKVISNRCEENQIGILAKEEASPEIRLNHCKENEVGICYAHKSSGLATENVCCQNKSFGIHVGDEAAPDIKGNFLEKNKEGIVFSGSTSGSATENVCRLNTMNGIHVTEKASPVISGNKCEENICDSHWHKYFGIKVSGEASPEISRNHCESNIVGIGFFGSSSGKAVDNVCCWNVLFGILVKEQASPEISRNTCAYNDVEIGFFDSSSGLATENICYRNPECSIIVRDKASPVVNGTRWEKDGDGGAFSGSKTNSLSFEEAKKRAMENPGAVITKSPDGTGYMVRKNL